jgi:REP element-mobilizing transposase RayT
MAMSKFNDKYRIESIRIKGYDYSQDGYYYLTICAKDRKCIFSEIIDDSVILSDLGNIIEEELKKSCEIRKEIILDEYIIMPNHIHLIIRIEKINSNENYRVSDKPLNEEEEKTTHRSSLHLKNFYKKSVASFVMGFKQAVTRSYRTKIDNQKYEMWQPRFYENIIRSEKTLFSIRNYIQNNPINWEIDEYKKTI